jgi:hypothetical protein
MIETQLDGLHRSFRPELYSGFEVYVRGYGVKGFVCRITAVNRVASARVMKRPLDSGLTFSIDNSSATVGKLLTDIPYEVVIDAQFVLSFFYISFFY